jgi:outer membrane protein assembly factor BamB
MRSPFVPALLVLICVAGCATRSAAPTTTPPSAPTRDPASAMPSASQSAPSPTDVVDFRGDAARSGNMPGPAPSGTVAVRWTFQAGAPIGSQVVVVGQTVYVLSTDGTLHAVDIGTGKQAWSTSIGASAHGSPAIADGLLIVGADDGAHAFKVADKTAAWANATVGTVRGAPAIVGHEAVFASDQATATALDTRTGSVLWSRPLGAMDGTSVAAGAGSAIFGLQDGIAVALALADGTEQWRVNTGTGARLGTPTIADGRVYVAALDGAGAGSRQIIALDLPTGRVLWRFASPGDKPAYAPAVADGRAIVEGEDGSVTALDQASGAVLWQVKAGGIIEIVPAIAGSTVYGASNGGMSFALDTATGVERWRVPITGTPYGEAVISGLVLVGTNVGNLVAIGGSLP